MILLRSHKKTSSKSNRHWHRRWIILRSVKLGGKGTPVLTVKPVFIFICRVWARRSETRGWLFSETKPIRVVKATEQ